MQIQEIIKNKDTIFAGIEPKKVEEQIKTLRYIELIAMQANIDISKVDVMKMFKSKSASNTIITNPRFINRILFSFHEDNSIAIKRKSLEDLLKSQTRLEKTVKKAHGNKHFQGMKELGSTIKGFQDRLKSEQEKSAELQRTDYIKYFSTEITRLTEYAKGQDALREQMTNVDVLVKQIAKVVNAGFWKFIGVSGTKLKFITSSDVILFEKNPKGKLNLQKNMGTYLVKLDLIEMEPIVHTFRGNVRHFDCIHPYVSEGVICFGNSYSYFHDAQSKGDIYEIMNMVGMVLGTYSSAGGPHRSLLTFMNLNNQVKMTKEAAAYYAKQDKPKKTSKVDELLESISTKAVSNGLAKTIGKKPENASDQEFDDDENESEDDSVYV